MANVITSSRILFSIIMIFCKALSPVFYVFYALAGFTDMIDGTVARKMNKESAFGAKLDTVADFIFLVVCLIKVIPVVEIPIWICYWIGGIAGIKVVNIIYSFARKKQLLSEHTILNKTTGFLLFCFPLTINQINISVTASILCVVATLAAIEENIRVRCKD